LALFWILATTSGCPEGERFAVSGPMTKFDAGAPPAPTDRYMRMPARFTSAPLVHQRRLIKINEITQQDAWQHNGQLFAESVATIVSSAT
jgi:hypothetical protein